jgi:hypothetical protein
LAEGGRDIHEQPLIQAGEGFHEGKGTLRLRLLRDWGHLLRTSEEGDYGVLVIPHQGGRRRDGLPPAFTLTPEMLDRVGIEVEAHLTSVNKSDLGPLGAATGQWLGTGTMSRREAIALRGHPDPDDVIEELDYEQVLADPDIQKARRLKMLRARDPETYELVREIMKTQQQPPPGGGGFGQMPQTPAAFGPQMTAGVNMPALGQGQIGATGRPPGVPQVPTGTDVGP